MARQSLIHYTAGCHICGASVAARNAMAWAHNHANRTGHEVELSLGWIVTVRATPQDGRDEGERDHG